jgi:hypothetical protein
VCPRCRERLDGPWYKEFLSVATTRRLVSVKVGLPRNVTWLGKTVHTGIRKKPVQGRVIVRRLNVDGDGQGDLTGLGGLNRPVMVIRSIPIDTGSANSVVTISLTDNSEKTSPLMVCLTPKCPSVTVIG